MFTAHCVTEQSIAVQCISPNTCYPEWGCGAAPVLLQGIVFTACNREVRPPPPLGDLESKTPAVISCKLSQQHRHLRTILCPPGGPGRIEEHTAFATLLLVLHLVTPSLLGVAELHFLHYTCIHALSVQYLRCIHRRSMQLEGQGTPRNKGRHSGFSSHVLESKTQHTQLNSFRLNKKSKAHWARHCWHGDGAKTLDGVISPHPSPWVPRGSLLSREYTLHPDGPTGPTTLGCGVEHKHIPMTATVSQSVMHMLTPIIVMYIVRLITSNVR